MKYIGNFNFKTQPKCSVSARDGFQCNSALSLSTENEAPENLKTLRTVKYLFLKN